MDIHSVRQQLRGRTIYDIPMRVTYYARVSSESDEQLNSLGNQISYYEDFIRRNTAWTFVQGYVDEGLSAATTRKRENFHRMIDDAKRDLFDLVITKEITRFARNTLDSIQYTRELLSAGVGVFFQNDNINTLDEDSELRLTIMSGIAQDELRKLSSRVKFGHQQAIKKSVVLCNSRIFGYLKDGGRLVIDESEAPMVRELFDLYATGRYSMKQLETLFWERGYRNHNGKKIAHTTMSGIISNPKYKGYYVGNKVKVIDLFTKKQKFLPPEEWVMFKDESGEIVPAIVTEDVWDAANAVLKKRSEDVKSRQGICNHANLLTGKLYCTCCGAAYYRRDSKGRDGSKNSKWVCSGKIKNGAASCDSFAIYEDEIKPLLLDVFRETAPLAENMVEEYIIVNGFGVKLLTRVTHRAQDSAPDCVSTEHSCLEERGLAYSLGKTFRGVLVGSARDRAGNQAGSALAVRCDLACERDAEYIKLYQQTVQSEDVREKCDALRRVIDTAEKKKQKLLMFNAMGELSDQDFLSMNRQCTKEIENAQKELAALEAQQASDADFARQIDTIRRVLRDAERDAAQGVVTSEFVGKYIDKIFVTPEGPDTMRLGVKILTGDMVERSLEHLKRRTGHTFLTI